MKYERYIFIHKIRGVQSFINIYSFHRWEEINKHSEKASRWIVIDRLVYDVTSWSKKHPGGSVLLGHFAGQDASVSIIHLNIDYPITIMNEIESA